MIVSTRMVKNWELMHKICNQHGCDFAPTANKGQYCIDVQRRHQGQGPSNDSIERRAYDAAVKAGAVIDK
jgi:hypothetical protein